MKKKLLALLTAALLTVSVMIPMLGTSAAGEAPSLKIISQTLSLEESVNILFRACYDGIDTARDEYGMIFWKAEREDGIYTYANAEGNDAALIRKGTEDWSKLNYKGEIKDVGSYVYPVFAKQMTDMVYAEAYAVKDGTYYYSDIIPYSVTTYAARKLGLIEGVAATEDESLKELLLGMLEYGALAQKHFSYKTENLATDILENAVPNYTVTFKDHDGTVLKTEIVKKGSAATAPADPVREGYTFTGWDKAFDNITGNTVVTAAYAVAEQYDVKFSFTGSPVKAGEELVLTLSVASKETALVDGLLAYQMTYDTSALEFLGFDSYGKLVTDSVAGSNSIITANKMINLGYSPAIAANGDICTLRFKVKDTVTAGTQLTVSMGASASKNRVPISGTIIAPSYTFAVAA